MQKSKMHPYLVKNSIFITLALLLLLMPVFLAPLPGRAYPATKPLDEPNWRVIWRDEFNGEGGVSTSKWLYSTGTGYPGGPPHWNTGEVEVMTDSLDNVFQSDGYLHIRALHSGSDPLTGWTSGRIETLRTDFQPPANGAMAIEGRIQLPALTGKAAKGYWPAFWSPGEGFRSDYWGMPTVGEMDVLESIDGENHWWGSFHCGPSKKGGPCDEPHGLGTNYGPFSPSLQSAFHTYRLEFDKSVSPQEMRWYIDGKLINTLFSSAVDAATWEEATNHGFFIILSMAIGSGYWRGNPTAATASGGTMLVDYVRVYALPAQSSSLPITYNR
jgi:beta-glucanase (GH16 family)